MDTQTVNGPAPMGERYKLGGKGGKVAQAWEHVWGLLSQSEYREGQALVADVAKLYGLKEVSLRAHLSRMAKEGILLREQREVPIQVSRAFGDGSKTSTFTSNRSRTHYRINPDRPR